MRVCTFHSRVSGVCPSTVGYGGRGTHCCPTIALPPGASPRYLPNIPPLTFDIQSTTHADS